MTPDQQMWEQFPKLQWMHNTCDLLAKQNKSWCPFPTDQHTHPVAIYSINDISNGYVWVQEPQHIHKIEANISKGTITNELKDLPGELNLMLTGFAMMNLKCYLGDITFTVHDNTITQIKFFH